MGETTAISWCDHTFNPWIGCMKLSPACDGCYAWAMMDRRYGRVQFGGPGIGTGSRALTSDSNWKQPLRWNRKAAEAGTHPFVFGGSLMDPFDKHVPPAWRRRYFEEVIRPTPNLVWLLLTKRPQLIIDLAEDAGGLPPNVGLGTTCEDQERWDQNVPHLVTAKAVTGALFAFVSAEPLLGRINPRVAPVTADMKRRFGWWTQTVAHFDPLHRFTDRRFKLDWIITGGETDQGGHKARPTHPQWIRAFRDACADTDTPYHHKQNGEFGPPVTDEDRERFQRGEGYFGALALSGSFEERGNGVLRMGKHRTGRMIDGREHNDRPQVAA